MLVLAPITATACWPAGRWRAWGARPSRRRFEHAWDRTVVLRCDKQDGVSIADRGNQGVSARHAAAGLVLVGFVERLYRFQGLKRDELGVGRQLVSCRPEQASVVRIGA
jgi:hypothetical protein